MNTGSLGIREFLNLEIFSPNMVAKHLMLTDVDVKRVARQDMKQKFAVVN